MAVVKHVINTYTLLSGPLGNLCWLWLPNAVSSDCMKSKPEAAKHSSVSWAEGTAQGLGTTMFNLNPAGLLCTNSFLPVINKIKNWSCIIPSQGASTLNYHPVSRLPQISDYEKVKLIRSKKLENRIHKHIFNGVSPFLPLFPWADQQNEWKTPTGTQQISQS